MKDNRAKYREKVSFALWHCGLIQFSFIYMQKLKVSIVLYVRELSLKAIEVKVLAKWSFG